MSVLTHLDLFSGIGGFSLAAGWAGYETTMFCEIDPFCQKVLRKHWPDVRIHDDIRTLTGELVGQPIELLTGGFPCQPFSVAGDRRGDQDDRHLWPEMARVIGECRPRWVLGENVTGFIGMALDDCLADLESIGYEAWTVVLPACAVGAWHQRQRVWIVAKSRRQLLQGIELTGTTTGTTNGSASQIDSNAASQRRQPLAGSVPGNAGWETVAANGGVISFGGDETLTNATDGRIRRGIASGQTGLAAQLHEVTPDSQRGGTAQSSGGVTEERRRTGDLREEDAANTARELLHRDRRARNGRPESANGDWWEFESRVRGIPHGLSSGMDGRAKRLKSLGNSIVPAVAYEIIMAMREAA